MENIDILNEDNWKLLQSFFPRGWEDKAYETCAFVRARKIDSPEVLIRILLIHLISNFSLKTTVVKAEEANICQINHTDLFKRLKSSWEWLRWLAHETYKSLNIYNDLSNYTKSYHLRVVDSTTVSKPGSKGTDWRIHYSINLNNLNCDYFEVTDYKVGESLKRYEIRKGDLAIGDRGYCKRKDIINVIEAGGEVLLRYHSKLPLRTYKNTPLDILKKLKELIYDEILDYDVYLLKDDGKLQKGRVIAVRKTQEASEHEKKRLKQEASRKGTKLKKETLEFAEYMVVFTSANRHRLNAKDVLRIYKARWQIELSFKRMKSIMDLGQLPKLEPVSSRAWLNGKMFVAMLIEKIHWELEFFSPWGFKIENV